LVTTPFTPYSLFHKVRIFYQISAFDAQGSRVTIVVVHVAAVKIYAAAMEALRQKDETLFTTKIGGKISLGPSYFVL
jgi:hypothetical protein